MTDRAAVEKPAVSLVIASYNYGRFIGQTLKSILDQSVQNFEIIVVDDASADNSCDVVRSFPDARIHLHVNEKNGGLADTFNKGVTLANGEYVCYVASDDWIAPRKIEQQLDYFRQNPGTDILGGYLNFVDLDGHRHELAGDYEEFYNQPYDFNLTETWIGDNKLTAPAVMLRRSVLDRIGLRDTTMTVGSDFELWLRAHAQGCRFAMLTAPLANHRIHGNSLGRRDERVTFLDMTYALQKTLMPAIEKSAALHLLSEILNWVATHPQFRTLTEDQRYRLLALLMSVPRSTDCTAYRDRILNDDDPALIALGKRSYAAYFLNLLYETQPLSHVRLQAYRSARLKQWPQLPDLLRISEADRAARLEQIIQLTDMLRISEADRAARLDQIIQLTDMVRISEADREAQLEQINQLTERLREVEAKATARSV